MKTIKYASVLIVFLTIASLVASTVVLYDPNSAGVPNRVISVITSADTPSFSGLTNALINPTLPETGKPSDWKVSGGSVVALTAGDLSAIADANAAIQTANLQLRDRIAKTNALASATANALDVDGRLLKAMAEVTMDEINILRSQIQMARTNTTAFQSATNRSSVSMNDRTMTQLRTAINNKLTAQADNN